MDIWKGIILAKFHSSIFRGWISFFRMKIEYIPFHGQWIRRSFFSMCVEFSNKYPNNKNNKIWPNNNSCYFFSLFPSFALSNRIHRNMMFACSIWKRILVFLFPELQTQHKIWENVEKWENEDRRWTKVGNHQPLLFPLNVYMYCVLNVNGIKKFSLYRSLHLGLWDLFQFESTKKNPVLNEMYCSENVTAQFLFIFLFSSFLLLLLLLWLLLMIIFGIFGCWFSFTVRMQMMQLYRCVSMAHIVDPFQCPISISFAYYYYLAVAFNGIRGCGLYTGHVVFNIKL